MFSKYGTIKHMLVNNQNCVVGNLLPSLDNIEIRGQCFTILPHYKIVNDWIFYHLEDSKNTIAFSPTENKLKIFWYRGWFTKRRIEEFSLIPPISL